MTPRTIRIYSENNAFQHAEVLRRNRHKRQRFGEFFVEGVRPINLALQHGWDITAFLYSPEKGLSDWAARILRESKAQTHYELLLPLLQKLSEKSETSELIALTTMPPDDPARIPVREDALVVVADRPQNPGNLGTLIRSCDALGVHGLILTGHTADLYDPETIRASTGSLFALPSIRLPSAREVAAWVESVERCIGPVRIVGSDEDAQIPLWEHDFRKPTVLLVGNETWGLSAAYHDLCTAMVRIPIGGAATSLNLASAASIILYEIERQRSISWTER